MSSFRVAHRLARYSSGKAGLGRSRAPGPHGVNSPRNQTKRPQTKAYGRFSVEAPGVESGGREHGSATLSVHERGIVGAVPGSEREGATSWGHGGDGRSQIAEALEAAHEAGVIHRDLKEAVDAASDAQSDGQMILILAARHTTGDLQRSALNHARPAVTTSSAA